MLEDLDFRAFLSQWSAEAIAHSADLGLGPSAEQMASQWLGRPPATADQIAEAEARLGRPLPFGVRAFYSTTNGWPITSFDFGEIVPIEQLGWFADVDPKTFEIWSGFSDEGDEDSDAAILARSVLISDGTDKMLLDTGAPPGAENADVEWRSFGLTSWYPGIGDDQPDVRAGLQSHYANFVRFHAPDSAAHASVETAVETAYRRLLTGDIDASADLEAAPMYGSERAEILLLQVKALQSRYRAGLQLPSRAASFEGDDAFVQDLWPMFVSSALDPRDYRQHALESALTTVSPTTAALLSELVARHRRDGGLRADYAGVFGAAVAEVRTLVRAGRPDAAWSSYVDALSLWRPVSPLHLAPMAIVWDADLATLNTRQRCLQVLQTPRG